jgi:hypothetical protein
MIKRQLDVEEGEASITYIIGEELIPLSDHWTTKIISDLPILFDEAWNKITGGIYHYGHGKGKMTMTINIKVKVEEGE